MEFEGKLTTVNNVQLYRTATGEGSPVVLLHGNGEDHHIFDALLPSLAGRHRLYAIDSRNHGRSQKTDLYDYAVMARDTGALIEREGLIKPYIIGFSDGAIIALLMALDAPSRIGSLALLGVNLNPGDFLEEDLRAIQQEYEENHDPLLHMMLTQPDIPLDALRSISNPVLLIAGERDVFRPGLYTDMEKAFPDARLSIFEGESHDSYIGKAELLAPVLLEFFQAV